MTLLDKKKKQLKAWNKNLRQVISRRSQYAERDMFNRDVDNIMFRIKDCKESIKNLKKEVMYV